eukprot:SAG22_NODE_6549_length_840_cov_1.863698_3_plen_59_part_00
MCACVCVCVYAAEQLARLKLGMFDPPGLSAYNRLGQPDLQTPASTATNRRAAAKGMVR